MAGSPGKTRVSRKVTITTPINVGTTVTSRFKITMAFEPQTDAAISPLRLHDRTVVELTVKPVDIAGDVLLRGDIQEWLKQRNARDLLVCLGDESLDVPRIGFLVADRRRRSRPVDQDVHVRVYIARRIEDRVLTRIRPEEEIFGIVEPAREEIEQQRHGFLGHLAAPIGTGHLVDRRLDADLRH